MWGIFGPNPLPQSIKMIIWPYKKFTMESPLKAEEYSAAILNHSEKNASGYYWFRRSGRTFAGEADLNGFYVIKTVPYWNLSPVKISGKYILDEPLIIQVKMENQFALPVFVLVVLMVSALLYNYGQDIPVTLLIAIILVFYFFINIPFQIEAGKAKKILLEISRGK